ncbi:MAG: sulfotransferase, partial [Gammaproteobacteria bacterium]|nr:sulfotransferase [Gammaproteobacteria bacterium]
INWPGPLTRYVRYNRWVREREEEWPQAIPQLGVSLDNVLKQARRYARDNGVSFDTTYPGWMLEGLARLVAGFNAPEAGLLAKRIGHCVFDLCRILRNNAELAGERMRLPEIGRQRIERPVFIVGINRTGTTFLHRLLARDRRFWALRAYEYVEPVIPDGDYATVVGTPRDPRRIKAADVFAAASIVDSLAGLHHVALDEPEEDIPILRLSLKTWGSWCSLVERFRSEISEPRPREELSTEQLRAMSRMLDRAVDFRDSHPELEDRWVDVSYYDLVQDPMAVVAHIYDRRGWSLEHETAAAMEAWLDELLERRRTEKRHRYDIADYGLTREMIDAAFVRYREFVSERGIRES